MKGSGLNIKNLKSGARLTLSGRRAGAAILLLFAFILAGALTHIISGFSLRKEIHDIVTNCLNVLFVFPLVAGVLKYFLVLSRGEKKKSAVVFSAFNRDYMTVVYFGFFLFALLWAADFVAAIEFERELFKNLAVILRGFVYLFSCVFALFGGFVIADAPKNGIKSILSKTTGCAVKGCIKLALLTLSFVLWFILGVFTAGVALLWALPYYLVACAKLYDGMNKKEEELEEEPEEILPEPEKEADITADISKKPEEKKPSADETIVFTKEMLEKIKNSGKNN